MRVLVLALLGASLQGVSGSRQPWPTHTVCHSRNLKIYYSSCDPLQDVGVTFSHCPVEASGRVNIRGSVLLRQSIEELYLSVDVSRNGEHVLKYDMPLCECHFPRFISCGRKKGELVTQEGELMISFEVIPKGQLDALVVFMNQNSFQIACFNVTIIKT
ncbi:hypothetical protein AAFF_G00002240 [Aldrovandia affinis]|uniref:MD-2-related lipid-recognition domain-containing protein n=1 Tax=Aldrovandia affinis TaxID=143900 RepID=A0AAD7X3D9_9TELE|nr:hypothetical protein AAFF_G00002240 [Aldrovandia affinis]